MRAFTMADMFTDPAAERSLLAALLADPETYFKVVDLAPVEVWTEHAAAFEQVAAAIEKGEPVPPLVDGEPAADPVEVARRLAALYQKRMLAALLEDVSNRLHNTDAGPDDLIRGLENGVSYIHQSIRELRAGQTVALPDLFDEVLKQVQARFEAVRGGSSVGLPTGLRTLDQLLGGLQKGIHLLAAEPGKGKTTFALQIARKVAEAGYPALFVSFEESLDRLALKALCSAASLPFKRFTDGYGKPEELMPAIREYGPRMKNLHFVEGTARLTVAQVKAKALQLMALTGKERCLIVVDYLQQWANRINPESLSETEGDRRTLKDFRFVVGRLAGQLRELSLRLNSPVLVISSQNRSGQGSGYLTSLKESGDLEYSADSAWFLVSDQDRPTNGTAQAVNLVIEKNRYGDKGKVKLIFRREIQTFAEVYKE